PPLAPLQQAEDPWQARSSFALSPSREELSIALSPSAFRDRSCSLNPQPEFTFMKIQQSVQTRREFLSDVGRGMITATVGYGLASELGLATAFGGEEEARLDFGALEPLVQLMQETPAPKLL